PTGLPLVANPVGAVNHIIMSIFVIALVLLSALMHASWNLLARRWGSNDFFLRVLVVITVIGLPLAVIAEFSATPVWPVIWTIVPISGVFQAIFFWGIPRAYRSGDFTIVYPLSRAFPVLLIAMADGVRGHPPAPLGWFGIALVTLGCLLIPLESLRGVTLAR